MQRLIYYFVNSGSLFVAYLMNTDRLYGTNSDFSLLLFSHTSQARYYDKNCLQIRPNTVFSAWPRTPVAMPSLVP